MERPSELLTPDDLCGLWKISRKTLNRWIRDGYVPGTREPFLYMKVGHQLRFSPEQVLRMEAHMDRGGPRRAPRRKVS